MLLEKIEKTIKKYQLINHNDKIIVGVSGGPDSVCLLHVLHQLSGKYRLKLLAAHVNYGYRGREADQDEQYVRKLTKELQVSCLVKKLRWKNEKKWQASNLEADFRLIRYNFFSELLRKKRADKIAVAHNQNDQAETILMFLLRGSGLQGLSGMGYQQGKIIRPLLNHSRQEILDYLQEHKLEFRQDKTNEDTSYTRNRLRHRLIPYLRKEYNPNLLATLAREANVIGDDYCFIKSVAADKFKLLVKKEKDKATINERKFQRLPVALRRGILRQVFVEFCGNVKDVSFLDLEETLRVLQESKSGSHRDVKGLRIAKNNGRITISISNLP